MIGRRDQTRLRPKFAKRVCLSPNVGPASSLVFEFRNLNSNYSEEIPTNLGHIMTADFHFRRGNGTRYAEASATHRLECWFPPAPPIPHRVTGKAQSSSIVALRGMRQDVSNRFLKRIQVIRGEQHFLFFCSLLCADQNSTRKRFVRADTEKSNITPSAE